MNKFLVKKPIITEKATTMNADGKYVFWVMPTATKPEVKKVVEKTYNVKVVDMHMINTKPKKRRMGRTFGTVPGYKKMIVTLAEGQKLDILQTA